MNNLSAEMRQTHEALQEALMAFDADTFNEVPHSGGWTAGQVSDHLLKSAGVTQVVHGRTSPTRRKPDEKVEMLRHVFLDMTTKLQSPDFILPGEGPFAQTEMRTDLHDVWTGLIVAAGDLDLPALCLDVELPVFGLLTRLEWISFYMVHTQRHVQQLHRINSALRKHAVSR